MINHAQSHQTEAAKKQIFKTSVWPWHRFQYHTPGEKTWSHWSQWAPLDEDISLAVSLDWFAFYKAATKYQQELWGSLFPDFALPGQSWGNFSTPPFPIKKMDTGWQWNKARIHLRSSELFEYSEKLEKGKVFWHYQDDTVSVFDLKEFLLQNFFQYYF